LHLNLRSNDLRSVAAGVSELRTLSTLDASDCDIGPTLNGVASRSLEWLSVAENNLRSMGQSAGPFPKLVYLDLRSNDLTTLAGLSSGSAQHIFPALCALDLSDNNLKDLRGLEGLKCLEALSLDHNDLGDDAVVQLCSLISEMPRLRFLACEENDWSDGAEQALEEHVAAINRVRSIDIDLYT
jgi:Leucine-rich repeat (LRR) protein